MIIMMLAVMVALKEVLVIGVAVVKVLRRT
jgi:hypothetical protein